MIKGAMTTMQTPWSLLLHTYFSAPIESGLPSVDAAKCQMSNQKRNSVVLLTSILLNISMSAG